MLRYHRHFVVHYKSRLVVRDRRFRRYESLVAGFNYTENHTNQYRAYDIPDQKILVELMQNQNMFPYVWFPGSRHELMR